MIKPLITAGYLPIRREPRLLTARCSSLPQGSFATSPHFEVTLARPKCVWPPQSLRGRADVPQLCPDEGRGR